MPKFSVLIIEDEKNIQTFMGKVLKRHDYQVLYADTGKQGLEMIRSRCPDLILLDLGLPDMDGCSIIRDVRTWASTPIIVISARTAEREKVAALDLGADDYITKPFSLMVLRARIRALLRRNTTTSEQEYRDSVFLFRFETMEFYKNGVQIELSKTEQRILYLLISNPNRILTRERLLEWVWPEGTEYVEDNALSVGIRRLRDKLEDDSSNPTYIKTVYGKGYVWESV